jgi:hypothetical protein
MPEIFTIIFDCHNLELSYDPLRIDDTENCIDANEALVDFLDDHHISYYLQDVTKDKLHDEQNRLEKLGIKEYGG